MPKMNPYFLLGIPAATCLLCIILHKGALHRFPQWKLLDFPERYGLKRKPLPYPTGVIGVFCFLAVLWATQEIDKQMIGLTIGIILIAGSAFIDDRKGLDARLRLMIQMLAAVVIFGFGTRIFSITNPILTAGDIKLDGLVIPIDFFDNPPLLSGIFTVVWLLLTINALNWFDGIPGQVSLLSTIGFFTIGALALSPRIEHINPELQQQLALLAFCLAGISLAGHLFDFPPNKVVLGDTGAMFFGLMLGVLTIYAGGKVATAFLVLGVPLIDSGLVILQRIAKGKSVMKGDAHNEHLHHRLLQKKWKPRSIIFLTTALGASFGITALFLSTQEKLIAALVLGIVMVGLWMYSRN